MKTRISLIYYVSDSLWKQFFASNSPQSFLNLIFFDDIVNAFRTVLTQN